MLHFVPPALLCLSLSVYISVFISFEFRCKVISHPHKMLQYLFCFRQMFLANFVLSLILNRLVKIITMLIATCRLKFLCKAYFKWDFKLDYTILIRFIFYKWLNSYLYIIFCWIFRKLLRIVLIMDGTVIVSMIEIASKAYFNLRHWKSISIKIGADSISTKTFHKSTIFFFVRQFFCHLKFD